jgi:hypothetical protein
MFDEYYRSIPSLPMVLSILAGSALVGSLIEWPKPDYQEPPLGTRTVAELVEANNGITNLNLTEHEKTSLVREASRRPEFIHEIGAIPDFMELGEKAAKMRESSAYLEAQTRIAAEEIYNEIMADGGVEGIGITKGLTR